MGTSLPSLSSNFNASIITPAYKVETVHYILFIYLFSIKIETKISKI